MPMEYNDFNNGKCGFKLIQYMACGVPTISTPLEANIKINRSGKNLHAANTEEWYTSLEKMILNKTWFREVVGTENSEIAAGFYSVESNTSAYIELFRKFD